MTLTLEPPMVPMTINPQGVALVRGTRVPIDTIITAFEQGDTPEEIAQNFSTVTVADAYYYSCNCVTLPPREWERQARRP